ncbi:MULTISPECIES: squalene synthase HpnC [unclassified Saccharibacter]|uniref:squalene synthase HpnC n=1 Tax=unclassified Saccharibacter TaxID=2648722 RepID=UPI001EF0F24B|nr:MULTISPECIES: squalene synthase HpnC [unclassified Saccharibacter]
MKGTKQTMAVDDVWGADDVTSDKKMGDENFPVGSFLIAPTLRPAVHAYYHFARVADDMVDNISLSSEQKLRRLKALRAVFLGEEKAPKRADAQTAVKLRQVFLERQLPFDVASDLIEAFCLDAEKSRYQSWDELLYYCRYSANPVGRFLLTLHGEDEASFGPSDALCTALQIVNHLQDVSKDLKTLDRCYVPLPWLADEGVSLHDLTASQSSAGVKRVFERMLVQVDGLNHYARTLPSLIRDRRMRLEAAVVVGLCRRLTERLHRQDPLAERVSLTKFDGVRALSAAMRYV